MFIRAFSKPLRTLLKPTTYKSLYRFAEAVADPYYILGVEKSTDYEQIKRVFYSLANQYHPDKNTSPDASRQFILIKEAFEAIKLQKGMSVAQNLEKSPGQASQQSLRPNPEQYETGYQEATFEQKNRDYRMEREKAPNTPQFDSFRKSFDTIHDINDIKVRVEQGVMKDSTERFGIQGWKGKIAIFKKTGMSYIMFIGIGLIVFFSASNMIYGKAQTFFGRTHLLESLKSQGGNEIQGNDNISTQEYQSMQKDPEYELYKLRKAKQTDAGIIQLNLQKQDPIFTAEGRNDVV